MRIALAVLIILLAAAGIFLMPRSLSYTPAPPPDEVDREGGVDALAARKIAAAEAEGVRPGNAERLVRHAPGRTPVAILYIHGYGASRANGEATIAPLAEAMGANTWYLRLPGHGTGPEQMDQHAEVTFDQYLDEALLGLAIARQLGERVVIAGSSTGGLLATWLAAQHPDQVDALILGSPFYAFVDPLAVMMDTPIGVPLAEALFGDVRDANWEDERKVEGYEDRWLVEQRYQAVQNLANLRRYAVSDELFAAVRAPALLLYYYADEDRQDSVASVPAMLDAFAKFNGGSPAAGSRAVAIEDGNHILLSGYVRTDKATIQLEIQRFLAGLGMY